MKIPQKGLSKEKIFQILKSYKGADLDWKSGRVLGYVYYPGDKAQDVIDEAYTMYLTENALDPTTFPSLLRLENEIVAMMANLLRGDPDVVGKCKARHHEKSGQQRQGRPEIRGETASSIRMRRSRPCFHS